MQIIREKEGYQSQIHTYANISLNWSLLTNKTILITGATGLIGTFLIDVLMQRNREFNEDIHIIAVGRDEVKARERLGCYWEEMSFSYYNHDVNMPFGKDCFSKNIDFIIHGASNTHPIQYASDPIGTINTNVFGTKNLLDLSVAQKNCRFVFLSSVEIYGENRGDTEYFNEEYCGYINSNTLRAGYPESKRLGEALCQAYISAKQADVVIPRLCRVYGPTMLPSDSKALAQFIKRAGNGEDIVLKSRGLQKYSYIYVADAVSAILTIMLQGDIGEAYNVADEKSDLTLKEIAEYLAKLCNGQVIYEIPDEAEKKGYSTATKALLKVEKLKALGWQSLYDMQEGLKSTYELLKQ